MDSPTSSGQGISVVIPAFNERDNLAETLAQLQSAAHGQSAAFECIVVDDGSTDGTRASAQNWAARFTFLRFISLPNRGGKCGALRVGFQQAKYAVTAALDADLSHDVSDVFRLGSQITERVGCVIGRRARCDNWARRSFSRIGNSLARWKFGIKIEDVNSSLRLFDSAAVRQIPYFRDYHRYLPLFVSAMGLEVLEVSVRHFPRKYGKSKYGFLDRMVVCPSATWKADRLFGELQQSKSKGDNRFPPRLGYN